MAYTQNQKATGLDPLTTLDSTDVVVIGDVSDSGSAKKITKANLEADFKTDGFYSQGGTDVAVADGGTGQSTYTKGDIIAANASTLQKVPVGTDGYKLLADSTQAPGIKWTPNSIVSTTYNLAGSPFTWNKPANLQYIDVELWGGGGSGASSSTVAGGGGGGARNFRRFFASELGSSVTITIGAGATAVTGNSGNIGGSTTFGSQLTAFGGGGGFNGTGSGGGGGGGSVSAGANPTGVSVGGVGGAPAGGATAGTASSFGGGAGGTTSVTGGASAMGGGGGGGAGSPGGSSWYGGGGGGGGDSLATAGGTSTYGGNGGAGGDASPIPTAGTVPGGGGGGSNAVGTASGAGAAGRAIVTEYY